MIGIFFGAGFSKWACDLPLANQLFDYNIDIWTNDIKKINIVKSLKDKWDENNPDKPVEAFIQDIYENHDSKEMQLVIWYICRRLSEPFIFTEYRYLRRRRNVLMIDEYRKLKIEGINKSILFLNQVRLLPISGFITTNYDLILEYALGTKSFNYGEESEILVGRGAYPLSQFKNPIKLRGNIKIAKIHGSLSWDQDNRYTDGRCGITGKANIVPPMYQKEIKLIETQWQLAKEILQNSSCLIFFGFGFNEYDIYVLDLIRKNVTQIRSILIIDVKQITTNVIDLFDRKTEVSVSMPPPIGNEVIRDWLINNSRI